MTVILDCQNLHKTYHDGAFETPVLKGVNLKLEAGISCAIIGSSGSGKSTLLHLMGALDKPSEGQVILHGEDIYQLGSDQQAAFRNKHLGFVYQFHHLLADFSAVENVAMPLLIAGVNRKDAESEAENMLERVGLAHRGEHRPAELSGGERQRVAIARALINKPSLVLADEPTGNLDEANAERIYQLMRELNRELGTAFVVVTHDRELASQLDIQYEMHNGVLQDAVVEQAL